MQCWRTRSFCELSIQEMTSRYSGIVTRHKNEDRLQNICAAMLCNNVLAERNYETATSWAFTPRDPLSTFGTRLVFLHRLGYFSFEQLPNLPKERSSCVMMQSCIYKGRVQTTISHQQKSPRRVCNQPTLIIVPSIIYQSVVVFLPEGEQYS